MKYKGMGVAMVTPMNANGDIDFEGLRSLTNYLIDNGTNYLVVQGTTGESPTLSWDEKLRVLELVIEVNQSRLPIVFGVGGNNTRAIVEQLKIVDNLAIDGILSVSPAYNKPTQEGIIAHFNEVCSATSKDVILYNVPGRTSSNMTAETTIQIAKSFPNVVAVKEASGSMEQIMDLLNNKPSGFEIISGDDPLTYAMMSMGAAGIISVVGNALPKLFSTMTNALSNESPDQALKIHNSLLDFTKTLFKDGNPAGVKVALNELNVCESHVRLPLVAVSSQTRNEIITELQKLVPTSNS